MTKSPVQTKSHALKRQGCLNAHPETVNDPLFRSNPFFDPNDMLQIKYEMLRRVREDGATVSQVSASFGVSRPTWYLALRAYEQGGLPALLPDRPGPRRAHKLSEEVVDALCTARREQPDLKPDAMVELVRSRFGISVHRRSIERALAKKKKRREPETA